MERKFQFVEPNWGSPDPFAIENSVMITVSRSWIISTYFKYWAKRMNHVGKVDQITYENCIDDFCVVHWAIEL